MYGLLIVDDEAIVREALKSVAVKSSSRVRVVGEAENGRRAIEMAEELKPDVIFMDIKMPGINGIEATKEIRAKLPNARVIIMTAYDYFNYAKEALQLGVQDYLLKPVKKETILEILEQAVRSLDMEREIRKKDLVLKEKLNTVRPFVEAELTYSLIFGGTANPDVLGWADLLEVRLNAGFAMVATLGQGLHNVTGMMEKTLLRQKVYDCIRDVAKNNCPCLVSPLISDHVVIFVSIDEDFDPYNIRVWSINLARIIREQVKKMADTRIFVGIGQPYCSIERLHDSYHEALVAATTPSVSQKVNHYGDINPHDYGVTNYPLNQEKLLCEKICYGDLESCVRIFDDIFDKIVEISGDSIHKMQSRLLELLVVISRTAYECGVEEDLVNAIFLNHVHEFLAIKNPQKLYSWYMKNLKLIWEKVALNRGQKISNIVARATAYIQENYANDLTLEEVAKTIGISPYYLSKVFKEQRRENFIDYLTQVRLTVSKKLLAGTGLNMKEICYQVGYNDPNYFSRVFKKEVGITPSDYRKDCGRES